MSNLPDQPLFNESIGTQLTRVESYEVSSSTQMGIEFGTISRAYLELDQPSF